MVISKEELQTILEALQEAYAKAGKKLETATRVDNITEDGTIEGEVLLDNRNKEELQ